MTGTNHVCWFVGNTVLRRTA